jgi:hypothetical protein
MRTIIIKLPPAVDLSFEMAEMRGWLDHHSCVPSSFKYDLEQDSTIIHVQFIKEEEAEIFKRHFDGNESDIVNSEPPKLLETIERACWWRLMAEEIRAEADGFSSDAAKETMANVAQTYDRMADDLERRLGNLSYQDRFQGLA